MRKEFNSQRIFWVNQHGRRSLFWNTNMAAVTSCQNTMHNHMNLDNFQDTQII